MAAEYSECNATIRDQPHEPLANALMQGELMQKWPATRGNYDGSSHVTRDCKQINASC